MLPAGDPDNDYKVEIIFRGADALGTFTDSFAYATVWYIFHYYAF